MESASAIAQLTATSAASVRPRTMIKGRVDGNQQALVTIDVLDYEGCRQSLEVMLDSRVQGVSDFVVSRKNPLWGQGDWSES